VSYKIVYLKPYAMNICQGSVHNLIGLRTIMVLPSEREIMWSHWITIMTCKRWLMVIKKWNWMESRIKLFLSVFNKIGIGHLMI
jgi:hypothetical protein